MVDPVSWPTPDPLSWRAEETPWRTALVSADSGESWTYGELVAGPVGELAGGLRGAGLSPGDHVGVRSPPGMAVSWLVHATARAGLVFAPLSPDAPAAVVEERAEAASLDAIVVSGSGADELLETDAPVIPVESLAGPSETPSSHGWVEAETQWLVFSSGTTGEPRPVRLTAGNLLASATASARRLGVEEHDRWLACLPMHHVGGLAPLVRSARYGTAAVVQAGFEAKTTAAAIEDRSVTGVSLVPTMLTRLLDIGWSPPEGLRFVLLGGAPAPAELIDRCEAAGVPVHPTYGATETASQIATAKPTEAFEHRGTVGEPLEGLEVDVRDAAGTALTRGSVGEFVVAGPVVSPGYYGSDSGGECRLVDGSFHTRDRGYRDGAGRLWVLGRVDDAIHTGGVTVHPEPIEACLRHHGSVEEAAVVGLEDPEWGEIVAALVSLAPGTSVEADALIEHCRTHLDAPSVPKLVASTEELPRTASGTVDRRAVTARLSQARREGF